MKIRYQGWEYEYARCSADDVPAGVRFDTPRADQGQIVEYSYGTFGRGEAGPGDPFANVTDHGDGDSRYYRLVGQTWVRGREASRA